MSLGKWRYFESSPLITMLFKVTLINIECCHNMFLFFTCFSYRLPMTHILPDKKYPWLSSASCIRYIWHSVNSGIWIRFLNWQYMCVHIMSMYVFMFWWGLSVRIAKHHDLYLTILIVLLPSGTHFTNGFELITDNLWKFITFLFGS